MGPYSSGIRTTKRLAGFALGEVGPAYRDGRALSALAMRLPTTSTRAKSCSHRRSTRHPLVRSSRLTRRSRATLAASFASQKEAFVTGFVKQRGQRCQKQPSTNTASFDLANAKSGRPGRAACLRHPVIPFTRRIAAKAISVLWLPFPRIRDITSERLALVKTSAIASGYSTSTISHSPYSVGMSLWEMRN